jgi:hypothetical protein
MEYDYDGFPAHPCHVQLMTVAALQEMNRSVRFTDTVFKVVMARYRVG